MSKQVKTMIMYDGKVFGVKPSKYALKSWIFRLPNTI